MPDIVTTDAKQGTSSTHLSEATWTYDCHNHSTTVTIRVLAGLNVWEYDRSKTFLVEDYDIPIDKEPTHGHIIQVQKELERSIIEQLIETLYPKTKEQAA